MLLEDIQLLRCVECHGELSFASGELDGQIIVQGILECRECHCYFPVIDEVGVFFRRDCLLEFLNEREKLIIDELGFATILDESPEKNPNRTGYIKQLEVSKNWEYQWSEVSPWDRDFFEQDGFGGERIFWTFIPIKPSSVENKTVFIACGGSGREMYHIAKQNPQKIIVNEIGSEIYSLKEKIADHRKTLLLLRGDVTCHPVKSGVVDVTICDHALQHVFEPRRAFSALVDTTKSEGTIAICVYSYEHNFLMTHIVEPLKIILHRLPLSLQRALAFFPAEAIFLLIHLWYRPLAKLCLPVAKRLPLFEHMMFWKRDPFSFIWMACFDLIHAPLSYHFSKNEIEQFVHDNHLTLVSLTNTHGTTWSLVGKK